MAKGSVAGGAVLVVGVLVAGLAGGWWLRGHDDKRDAPAPGGARDEQVDALLERIERLEAQRNFSGAHVPASGPAPVDVEALMSPEQRDAQQKAEGEQFTRDLATAFSGQTAARAGDKVAAQVEAAFADPSVGEASALPLSHDIECRITMCRIRARFAAGADGSDWMNRLLLTMGGPLPNASVVASPQPDGSTEMLIYATRQGERAPVELIRH